MWFTANILYKGTHERKDRDSLWEESFLLIEATDKEQAAVAAEELGKTHEVKFATVDDEVHWTFHDVINVFELLEDDLADGTGVYSRFLSEEEAKSLMTPVDDEE